MKNKLLLRDGNMDKFNNETFKQMTTDCINDAFYVEGITNRGKLKVIRQLAEIVLRRILDFSESEFLTLGRSEIRKLVKKKTNNNKFLIDSIDSIKLLGNDATHTQNVNEFTDNEFEKSVDSLFNMYAYLLITYFEEYEFGYNNPVISAFSILPPVIRFKVLTYLNENNYKDNVYVIDKLVLSILKTKTKQDAIIWIEDRKMILEQMSSVSEEARKNLKNNMDNEMAELIISNSSNMYDLCKKKIELVSLQIEMKGKRYTTFENAKGLYKELGIVEGNIIEITKFNLIMEFLYMGRKEEKAAY
ncbi:hypothetical protein [Vagococcus intermedius]|uniref:DUF4145 domain-containing protein n=1 Tax=Vagococcus intermedius TaxID=2991418 RepID=A0AAF0I5X0_9ENTE|nr:hypothetical protein [Vagococcus intermedius]WEG72434.1 hypothetical protein OL234_05465 [Vagococcus intermedius]WEG74521.1 hypothetical protein OL235_05470 [Vagococcus intermedius]